MRNFNRPLLYVDWISAALAALIACTGLLFVYSATSTPEYPYSIFFKKQAVGLLIGMAIYIATALIDYRTLMRWGYFAYFAVLILLLYTLVKGTIGMGAQRWIQLFFFKLQPSELAKLFLPAFMAQYFYSHNKLNYRTISDFIPLIALLLISFVLILKQPDLGTALIVLFAGFILLWMYGLSRRFFVVTLIGITIAAPLLWQCLKPYQRNRIAVFLGAGSTNKERYQIEQAMIAIGSGGLFGKGLQNGTQNIFQFLPESRTDFIFAVICEEWGFIGALCIMLAYAALFIRLLCMIRSIEKPYVQLLALGLLIHILLSAIINVCMVLGLLPIVGIPLPLMSYGLSNLFVTCASLGWLQGIYIQTV